MLIGTTPNVIRQLSGGSNVIYLSHLEHITIDTFHRARMHFMEQVKDAQMREKRLIFDNGLWVHFMTLTNGRHIAERIQSYEAVVLHHPDAHDSIVQDPELASLIDLKYRRHGNGTPEPTTN